MERVIVIGASAGGLDPLRAILRGLPAELPAAVCIAQHARPGRQTGLLPELLGAAGVLPAEYAVHGAPLRAGRVELAPPDMHLMLRGGVLHVTRGARENGHRPSIDALFRSAAAHYENRVIAVLLSGQDDCGTAGMLAVKAHGGVCVVQDPTTALAPQMPKSAIEHVAVDHVADEDAIAPLLLRLIEQPLPHPASPPPVAPLAAPIVCPSCQGTLTVSDAAFPEYRCHVGHTFSLRELAVEQAESLERALWAAVRALEETAALAARLASASTGEMRERFLDRQRTQSTHAAALKQMLLAGTLLSPSDVN